MSTGKIQVTPTSGTVLHGEPMEMAVQLCQKVVHPLLMALVADRGPESVIEFYAALLTHLALDVNGTLGTHCAKKMLSEAGRVIDRKPHVPGLSVSQH